MGQVRNVSIGLLVLVSLVSAGCSEAMSGSPQSDVTGEVSRSASSGTAEAPGPAGNSDISTVEPCELLDDSTLSRFAEFVEKKAKKTQTGEPYCTWSGSPTSASSEEWPPMVGVLIDPDAGLNQFRDRGGGLQRGKTDNGRPIIRTTSDSGCAVGMAVENDVHVVVSAGIDDIEESCRVVDQLVEIVDQKIPWV